MKDALYETLREFHVDGVQYLEIRIGLIHVSTSLVFITDYQIYLVCILLYTWKFLDYLANQRYQITIATCRQF